MIALAEEYEDATDGIRLPIVVDGEGSVRSLVFGAEDSAHTLITGGDENARHAFLHTIISDIISSYHADDAEIWLLDYEKTAFARYLNDKTAHIRFISLENAMEFTESFIGFLHKFFSRREYICGNRNAADLKEYREKYGTRSMPRVFLVVNGFETMTRSFTGNIVLRNLLEHALTEFSKYGLSCIFASKTADSLLGFTESGREQIDHRIAMMNTVEEIQNTLSLYDFDEDTLAQIGLTSTELLWEAKKPAVCEDSPTLVRLQMMRLADEQQKTLRKLSREKDAMAKEDAFFLAIDGLSRREITDAELQKHIVNTYNDKAAMNLCLGDPVQLSLAFHMYLIKRAGQNVLLTGKDTNNTFDILASILRSARFSAYKTVVLADAENVYYKLLKENLPMLDPQKQITILSDPADVAGFVDAMKNALSDEEAQVQTFTVWLGAEKHCEDMELLLGSGRNGSLHMLLSDSYEAFSKLAGVSAEQFEHKISEKMPMDDLAAFGYPYAQLKDVSFDGVKAIYSNGAKIFNFKPYRFL